MEDRIQSCGGRESPTLQMGVQSQRHCDCIQHNPQGPALRWFDGQSHDGYARLRARTGRVILQTKWSPLWNTNWTANWTGLLPNFTVTVWHTLESPAEGPYFKKWPSVSIPDLSSVPALGEKSLGPGPAT